MLSCTGAHHFDLQFVGWQSDKRVRCLAEHRQKRATFAVDAADRRARRNRAFFAYPTGLTPHGEEMGAEPQTPPGLSEGLSGPFIVCS